MKDFANFQPNDGKNQPSGIAEEWTEEAKTLASSFQGKSERDLMKAIYERALEGKRNGTLTNEQIDAFYAQFAPMLDSAKKKKLKRVVEQLKSM